MAIHFDDGSSSNDGRICQVVRQNITAKQSFGSLSGTSYTKTPVMSDTITLKSSDHEVLIFVSVSVAHVDNNHLVGFRIIREISGQSDVVVVQGDAAGNRERGSFVHNCRSATTSTSFVVRDSPSSSSAIKYVLAVTSQDGSNISFNGRQSSDDDEEHPDFGRYASSITLMEIAD